MEYKVKKLLALGCIGSLSFLTGCASYKIENFDAYSPSTMLEADVMPSMEELKNKKTKIVVFTADDSNIDLAKSAKAGFSISTSLEKHLSETGAEIVDRNIAKKLKSEIKLAEVKGKSTYEGPSIADYAITGNVSAANIGSKFYERSQYTDKKGKVYVTPARCKYTAQVTANLKVYKLPGLAFSKSVSIDDTVSVSEETRNSNCPYSLNAQQSLVRQAAAAAVKDSRTEFQNYFAPKAYVIERRINEDKNIFKLSRGTDAGFKTGSSVKFYNLEVNRNPLTQEVNAEESSVVEGSVSDKVGKKHAWVIVDEVEKAGKIRLGDYVKVTYEKGFLEGLPSF